MSTRFVWNRFNCNYAASESELNGEVISNGRRYSYPWSNLYPGLSAAETTQLIIASSYTVSGQSFILPSSAEVVSSGLQVTGETNSGADIRDLLQDTGGIQEDSSRSFANFYLAPVYMATNQQQRRYPFLIRLRAYPTVSRTRISYASLAINTSTERIQFYCTSSSSSNDRCNQSAFFYTLTPSQGTAAGTVSNAASSTYPP